MDKLTRIYEMGCKEVINLADGARLGYVRDVEINMETGQVDSLVIPGRLRFFGLLGREEDVVVPWKAIERIGEDIIFVRHDSLPKLRPPSVRSRGAGIF